MKKTLILIGSESHSYDTKKHTIPRASVVVTEEGAYQSNKTARNHSLPITENITYMMFCDIDQKLGFQKLFEDVLWSHVCEWLEKKNEGILKIAQCSGNLQFIMNMRKAPSSNISNSDDKMILKSRSLVADLPLILYKYTLFSSLVIQSYTFIRSITPCSTQ